MEERDFEEEPFGEKMLGDLGREEDLGGEDLEE